VRNRPESNFAPYALGSGSARFLRMLEGGHHDVKADESEQRIARLWIDCGAPYPGTYAALGSGMIGGYEANELVIENDSAWPETKAAAAVIDRRCISCHQQESRPLPRALSDEIGFSFWMPKLEDRRIRRNRHIVFNLSKPEKSLMVLAPLGQAPGDGAVFTNRDDPDFKAILGMCDAGHRRLDEVKRFDMPGFRPRPEWIGEMKRFGILAPEFNPDRDPVDVYATERAYWKSLQYHPPATGSP